MVSKNVKLSKFDIYIYELIGRWWSEINISLSSDFLGNVGQIVDELFDLLQLIVRIDVDSLLVLFVVMLEYELVEISNGHSGLSNEQRFAGRRRLNVIPVVLGVVRLILRVVQFRLQLCQLVIHAQYFVVLFLYKLKFMLTEMFIHIWVYYSVYL